MYLPVAALCAALLANNVFAELQDVHDSAFLQTQAVVGDEHVQHMIREELARGARPYRNGTNHAYKNLRRTNKEECRVILYDDEGFAGHSWDLGQGDHPTGDWHDRVTSLKVFGPGCVLKAYTDGNYNGQEVVFPAGEYDMARMESFGLPNDAISSLKVEEEVCRITLYDDAGFAGQSWELDTGDHSTGDWTNKVTSVKVFGPRCVLKTYTDASYSGQEAVFPAGEYDMSSMEARGLPNDAISSLKVEMVECLGLMYDNGDFTGAYKAYAISPDAYRLSDETGGPGNDAISSIQVIGLQETCFVEVFGDGDLDGWSSFFNPGSYDLGAMEKRGAVNDAVSSIYVTEVYTHNCERKQTPVSDDGEGNSIYLDRHDLACDELQMMAGWKLNTASSNTINFEYVCCDAPYLNQGQFHETIENDASGGDIRFLDRHVLECPKRSGANLVMTQWKMVHHDGRIKFQWTCSGSQVPLGFGQPGANCRNAHTGWNENGAGNARFLDRHELQCGRNEGMTKWHLVTSGDEMRFEYTCCQTYVDQTTAPTAEPTTAQPTTATPTALPTTASTGPSGPSGPVLSDNQGLTIVRNSLGTADGQMRLGLPDGVEVVVANVTEYKPYDADVNGLVADFATFAQLSVACGTSVVMVFSFVQDAVPEAVDAINFTIADLDKGTHGRCGESVHVTGYTDYSLYPTQAASSINFTDDWFVATRMGAVDDNPQFMEGMTENQKNSAVTFSFRNTGSFSVVFSASEANVTSTDPQVIGYAGRRILFGFGAP